jgi:serine protease Do
MSFQTPPVLVCTLAFLVFTLSGARVHAQNEDARRTAMVTAIAKTRPGIVTIRTPNPNGGKDLVGAGVIIDARGYIVTNRHVTVGHKSVKVRLHDGTDVIGTIVVADSDFDLAVIRIKTETRLVPLRITPADDLMVGETVFAIGNPYGYEGTVSRGIISALNREVTMPNDLVMTGLIQHDAPINPGNSGGPLVNLHAEVIGINVAMRDEAQNIGFAINGAMIDGVLSRLLSARKIAGIAHGLTCKCKGYDSDQPRVVVHAVAYESPAAKAGAKPGDVVLNVDGQAIVNRLDLERAFWDREAGEHVPVRILRQSEEKTLSVVVEPVAKAP